MNEPILTKAEAKKGFTVMLCVTILALLTIFVTYNYKWLFPLVELKVKNQPSIDSWYSGYMESAIQSFEIAEKYRKQGDMIKFGEWFNSAIDSLNRANHVR